MVSSLRLDSIRPQAERYTSNSLAGRDIIRFLADVAVNLAAKRITSTCKDYSYNL